MNLPEEFGLPVTKTAILNFGTQKHECDGSPGLSELATVLRGFERAEEELTTLLASQVLFWLIKIIAL